MLKNKWVKLKSEENMKAAVFPNFQKNNALECARAVCDILHNIDIGLIRVIAEILKIKNL